TVSFLVHATEDEGRLLQNVVDSFGISKEGTVKEYLEGHYGNSLTHFTVHVTGERATEISSMILSRLDQSSKKALVAELEKYLDEHDALYLRLDRQELPEKFLLGDDEPIRTKLKPKSRRGGRQSMIEAYTGMIEA
ncbi:MAG: RNA-binding domain-containing protein, partial [Nitrososphaerales archaeon]